MTDEPLQLTHFNRAPRLQLPKWLSYSLMAVIVLTSMGIVHAQEPIKFVFPWGFDLYVMQSGEEPIKIATDIYATDTTWSPDGGEILFNGIDGLAIIQADGNGLRDIITAPTLATIISDPVWSPDGKQIAFTYGPNGLVPKIYSINHDGTHLVQITTGSSRDFAPNWSPEGKQIAFTSNRDGDVYQLYIMNIDGTGLVRLTYFVSNLTYPIWSPDGQSIAFLKHVDNSLSFELYKIDIDGSHVTKLADINDPGRITWLPDSSRILYQELATFYSIKPDGTDKSIYLTLPNDRTDIISYSDPYFDKLSPVILPSQSSQLN